jgi:hypothetical protein
MEEKDAVLQALRDCDQKLQQLKTGEQLADHAENAFGELADTVETVLEERRVRPDRRGVGRAGGDRRRSRHSTA